jgi:hypothetical protein
VSSPLGRAFSWQAKTKFSSKWKILCALEKRRKKERVEHEALHGKSIRGKIEILIVLSSTEQTNIKIPL